MLTSFEVMQAAKISRATLNNYISQGLLPQPVVKIPEPGTPTRARQIGYFPNDVLARLERIRQLKKVGRSMAEIFKQLEDEGFKMNEGTMKAPKTTTLDTASVSLGQHAITDKREQSHSSTSHQNNQLHLTIDHIPFPAYMVNYNLEITWYNEEARTRLLGGFESLPAVIKDRNVLSFLLKGEAGRNADNQEKLLQFILRVSRGRLSRVDLMGVLKGQHNSPAMQAGGSQANLCPQGTMMQLPLDLYLENGEIAHYNVYVSYYREGMLFIYQPGIAEGDSLLSLLEKRDEVIRNLLKKQLPVLTDVAVLVADLQNSVRICTELPPEEYFELINQISIFRQYYGTHGKHVGDGMVYYFFPQPDCNYAFNAILCAQEIKIAMRKISKEWQLRKGWMNELYLNTGLNEGQEWLGIFHLETKVEFTVLGDTINHAARLSDFAKGGSVWATKNLLSMLSPEERKRVKFGICRQDANGQETLIVSTYSRISELVDITTPRNEKLHDIAGLPVTEVVEIGSP
jgi:adenylate cyclase